MKGEKLKGTNMHFILISKKETFKDEQISHDLLNSSTAPSLISREVIKFEISNFIVYIYPYNHIEKEIYGYSYYKDKNKLLLCNGLVNINKKFQNQDICNLFDQINDSTELLGDYQLISIDSNGNGYFKTPSFGLKQLFFYEDENCTVLSTEIKLIVDSIQKFSEKKFVDHYDLDFIEDSIFKEWINRNYPKNTIFKDIKRIFPQDLKYFKKSKIIIERKEFIEVPKWYKDAYNKDKNKLYDDYYKILMNFAETNLVSLKPNIKRFFLGLTGGFDSRLTVAILSEICKKHQIPLVCCTSGQLEHPDVIIAKKIAEILDINHFHHFPPNNCFINATEYDDYTLTFYMAQGDWN